MKNLLKLEYLSVLTIEIHGIILAHCVMVDKHNGWWQKDRLMDICNSRLSFVAEKLGETKKKIQKLQVML